jgi:hypothetical protein
MESTKTKKTQSGLPVTMSIFETVTPTPQEQGRSASHYDKNSVSSSECHGFISTMKRFFIISTLVYLFPAFVAPNMNLSAFLKEKGRVVISRICMCLCLSGHI